MAAFIARLVIWFGIGFFLAEIINSLALLSVRLHVLGTAGTTALVYGLANALFARFQRRAPSSPRDAEQYDRLRTLYDLGRAVVVVLLLFAVFLLWWGVIIKLAIDAERGLRYF